MLFLLISLLSLSKESANLLAEAVSSLLILSSLTFSNCLNPSVIALPTATPIPIPTADVLLNPNAFAPALA